MQVKLVTLAVGTVFSYDCPEYGGLTSFEKSNTGTMDESENGTVDCYPILGGKVQRHPSFIIKIPNYTNVSVI